MSDGNNGGCFWTVGTVIAAVWSWTAHHRWYMAIGHGILSWFYVLYHWLVNR